MHDTITGRNARRHRHLAPDAITADEVEQLAAAFTARLHREIADARDLLADELDAPLPRPYAADLPLIWRGASGELTPTLPEHDTAARPLSARELLDLLTDRAATFAEHEAETLALALVKLTRDDAERQDWRARAPSVWPWSAWQGFHGDDLLPSIVEAVETAARAKRGDTAPLPASDDAHEWASDTLERRREGYAQEIRAARAAGFAGLSLPGAVLAPRQLAALYGLLPATVRAAREIRRYVERVARGDEQRALLEQIAPAALKRARADVTDANRSTLAESTRRHVAAWRSTLPLDTPLPTTEAEAAHELDALAESLSVYIATIGVNGDRYASDIREKHAEKEHAFWQAKGSGARWLVTVALVVWIDQAAREATATDFALSVVRAGGDRYVKQPKLVAPISWAMGAPGVALSSVKLDGDRYAPEPAVATRLVPRTLALLSGLDGHERRPHQTTLDIETEEQALAVHVVGATHYAISPHAAKLALLILGSEEARKGTLQRATLGDWAAEIYPGARIQPRELQQTAKALDELDGLFVHLPIGNKMRVFEAISASTPANAQKSLPVAAGLSRAFAEMLAEGIRGDGLRGSEYNGDFLVNLDGAMRLSAKRPALLRHYVRAAAHWNAAFKPGGGFDPEKLRLYTPQGWATITNRLPLGVVEHLRSGGKRSTNPTADAAWRKERQGMNDELDELESVGLVKIERKREGFRLLPPDVHLEAFALARKAGTRPDE